MTAGTDRTPEEIRRDIEQARANLGEHLDDLEYRADPTRIRQEQTEQIKQGVRNRFTRVKESVMGSGDDYWFDQSRQEPSGVDQVRERAQEAGQRLADTPDAMKRQARGNPLAAGLVAFGGGLLLAALLPATEPEQELAGNLRDRFEEPLKDELRSVGQEVKEELQPQVQQAAEQIKTTAQDAAQHTKSEAQSTAESLKQEAQSSVQSVKQDVQQRAEDVRPS